MSRKIVSVIMLMLLLSGCIMQTPLETAQPVIEEEVEVMNSNYGAEMRLLQLQYSIEKQTAKIKLLHVEKNNSFYIFCFCCFFLPG